MRPVALLLLSTPMACATPTIPNTSVIDTPENRQIVALIETYRQAFPAQVVGLSGHDNGIAMAPVSYLLGARVLEKRKNNWKEEEGSAGAARAAEAPWAACRGGLMGMGHAFAAARVGRGARKALSRRTG